MAAMLRRLPAAAGLAVLAVVRAEVAGHRAYIEVTITGLCYDTAPASERVSR